MTEQDIIDWLLLCTVVVWFFKIGFHFVYLKSVDKSIKELILEKGLMTKEELDNALSKKNILGSKKVWNFQNDMIDLQECEMTTQIGT